MDGRHVNITSDCGWADRGGMFLIIGHGAEIVSKQQMWCNEKLVSKFRQKDVSVASNVGTKQTCQLGENIAPDTIAMTYYGSL